MFFELLKVWNGHQPGARLAFSAADAAPLVAAGVLKAVEDDPLAPVIARGLETALAGWMKGLDAVINQTLQKVAQAQTLSHKNGQPALFGPGNTGDPKKSFGDWALAVARNDRTYLEKHYGSKFNEWQQKAALGEASGVTGGYTVPPEFYQQLMTIMAEETFIRPHAFVVPMAGATLQIPYLDVSAVQSAGVSPFFGGVQMVWTAEAQSRTETEPQFKQMELKAWELSGYSVIPEAVQEACSRRVAICFNLTSRDPSLASLGIAGAMSQTWQAGVPDEQPPAQIRPLLAPYRRRSVGTNQG